MAKTDEDFPQARTEAEPDAGLELALASLVPGGDALIIVPPFAGLGAPSLAAHLLQACAREAGFEVRVLYANILLAGAIGEAVYNGIVKKTGSSALIGGAERLFAATAFGVPPLGGPTNRPPWPDCGEAPLHGWSHLEEIESRLGRWSSRVAEAVARQSFEVVGATTTFAQTSASFALLRLIKQLRPETVTVLGGANCEGEMAEGLAELAALQPSVDFIFSGESETSWPELLRNLRSGRLPAGRIIRGEPCRDLEALPAPRYREYIDQLSSWLPGSPLRNKGFWIAYESSRGCWWGEKSHCTFCGLNGEQMGFREKSADRVIADLGRMVDECGTRSVFMVDNIMPHNYFRTLIPRLGTELPRLFIHYEQKANLSLDKVVSLKKAGVETIQPGIEALSSSFLARMKKGVSAAQNLALLRYARAVSLRVKWNLLVDFPGDELAEYEQTLGLLPLLHHLHPPHGVGHLRLDRFSPYFSRPAEYGIRNLRPLAGYATAFPPTADLRKLAYHFEGDYESAARAHPEVVRQVREGVDAWCKAWLREEKDRPLLCVHRMGDGLFVLQDTRGLSGTREFQFLTRQEALLALVGKRSPAAGEVDWGLDQKVGVMLEGQYVPLATAPADLLSEFESEAQRLRRTDRAPSQDGPLLVQLGGRKYGEQAR